MSSTTPTPTQQTTDMTETLHFNRVREGKFFTNRYRSRRAGPSNSGVRTYEFLINRSGLLKTSGTTTGCKVVIPLDMLKTCDVDGSGNYSVITGQISDIVTKCRDGERTVKTTVKLTPSPSVQIRVSDDSMNTSAGSIQGLVSHGLSSRSGSFDIPDGLGVID